MEPRKTATRQQETDAPIEVAGPAPAELAPAVIEADVAISRRLADDLVGRLQNLERGVEILRRRGELLDTAYKIAIARTRPSDWVLTKDKQQVEVAMLKASGAQLVAPVYGLSLTNVRPVDKEGRLAPVRIDHPNGAYSYRLWGDVYVPVTSFVLDGLEATRRSDEDFTGRGVDGKGNLTTNPSAKTGALDSDLRQSVFTLLLTRAVRIGCGLTRVPAGDLVEAWKGTSKKLEQCTRGHGYGTSTERTARDVAGEGVNAKAVELGREILRRVGGEREAARKLLREVTSRPAKGNKAGFDGVDSVERLTEDWQVEAAWKRLREHSIFGDQHSKEEPGKD